MSEYSAISPGLPSRVHPCMIAVPAIGLLIELDSWGRRGLFASYFPLFRCSWKTNRFPFFLFFRHRLQHGKRFPEAFLRLYSTTTDRFSLSSTSRH